MVLLRSPAFKGSWPWTRVDGALFSGERSLVGQEPAWGAIETTGARVSASWMKKTTDLTGRASFFSFPPREKLVSVKKRYLYHDYQAGDTDVFSREPFVVWFQSPHTGETHRPHLYIIALWSCEWIIAPDVSWGPKVYEVLLGRH